MANAQGIGRPFGTFKYDNLDDLNNGIEAYFADCDPHPMIYNDEPVYNKDGSPAITPQRPYTMSGLALALNVTRQTLLNYGKNDITYFDTISRARQRVEEWTAGALYNRDMARGAEFSLKNNHGFKDQQDISLDAKGLEINIKVIE
jgi:hypothetical protein